MSILLRDYRAFEVALGYTATGSSNDAAYPPTRSISNPARRVTFNQNTDDRNTVLKGGGRGCYYGKIESFQPAVDQFVAETGAIMDSTIRTGYGVWSWGWQMMCPVPQGEMGINDTDIETSFSTYVTDPATVGDGGWSFEEAVAPATLNKIIVGFNDDTGLELLAQLQSIDFVANYKVGEFLTINGALYRVAGLVELGTSIEITTEDNISPLVAAGAAGAALSVKFEFQSQSHSYYDQNNQLMCDLDVYQLWADMSDDLESYRIQVLTAEGDPEEFIDDPWERKQLRCYNLSTDEEFIVPILYDIEPIDPKSGTSSAMELDQRESGFGYRTDASGRSDFTGYNNTVERWEPGLNPQGPTSASDGDIIYVLGMESSNTRLSVRTPEYIAAQATGDPVELAQNPARLFMPAVIEDLAFTSGANPERIGFVPGSQFGQVPVHPIENPDDYFDPNDRFTFYTQFEETPQRLWSNVQSKDWGTGVETWMSNPWLFGDITRELLGEETFLTCFDPTYHYEYNPGAPNEILPGIDVIEIAKTASEGSYWVTVSDASALERQSKRGDYVYLNDVDWDVQELGVFPYPEGGGNGGGGGGGGDTRPDSGMLYPRGDRC